MNRTMQKNETVTLTITDLNNLGYGVGRVDNRVVFVAGAVSGDIVKAKLIKINKGFCVGKLTEILQASPYRMSEAFCQAPESCGGCVYRHVQYEHELTLKRQYVEQAFRKCGLFDVRVGEVRHVGEPFGYRNKAQYPVKSENGRMRAGFYAAKTHSLVACEDCRLQMPGFSDIVQFICAYCEDHRISAYSEETGSGVLRHIYLRGAKATGQMMVCLVVNEPLPKERQFAEAIMERFPAVVSVMLNRNTEKTNVVLGPSFSCIGGRETIEDVLCSIQNRISAGSFYQVNHDGAELLYALAADFAKPDGKTILDLYCGTGTIGLSMARRAKKVIGVEIVEEAVERAKENAERNGISNAFFYCADASDTEGLLESIEKKAGEAIRPDVVILDPPRKGSTPELIAYLARRNIREVVYVSCDADTLARDCALFRQQGYALSEVIPVNMFPRTGHIESVVRMTKTENGTG